MRGTTTKRRKLKITHHHKKSFLDDVQDAVRDAVRGFIKSLPSAIVGGILVVLILKVAGVF